jgi:hypothetical protein
VHASTYADGELRADLVVAGSVVPEPSTYVLLGTGLLGLAVVRRRKRLSALGSRRSA